VKKLIKNPKFIFAIVAVVAVAFVILKNRSYIDYTEKI